MGKSLEEYAAQHPQPEPIREQLAARSYRDQMQEREQIEDIKASILNQLEQGAAPETLLYMALKAIGILTHDTEWTEAGTQTLDKVYGDLAQESLLTDNTAAAAQKLETLQTEYKDKLRRQLVRNLNESRRIERQLQELIDTIGGQ